MVTVRHHLGYRGLTLFMFGLIFCLIAMSLVAQGYKPVPGLIHTMLPIWFSVSIWLFAGCLGMFTAWLSRWHWLGFAALFIPPAERAFSYIWSMIVSPSISRIPGLALYAMLALTIVLFASWPEPLDSHTEAKN